MVNMGSLPLPKEILRIFRSNAEGGILYTHH